MPRSARARANQRLERANWDDFWLPNDVQVIERPEIKYYVCARPVHYLNQVVRTRAHAGRLPALVAEVTGAHAHAPARWNVFDTVPTTALEQELERAGYRQLPGAHAMVQDTAGFRPSGKGAGLRVRVVDDRSSLLDSIRVMERTFDHETEHSEAELADLQSRCTGPAARIVRMVAYQEDGPAITTGAMSLFPDLDLGYLWGGSTLPDARGQGGYSAVLAARIEYAQRRGIGLVGLHAIVDTSAPIVAALGFERCGSMGKWARDALHSPAL